MSKHAFGRDSVGSVGGRRLQPVDPNARLDPDTRRRITSYLENARSSMGEEEYFYIARHFQRKVRVVSTSRIPWVRALAAEMVVLHRIYEAHLEGEMELGDDAISTISVALFYFVNPYGVIPDHVPGKGYLDDAYVFERCLRELKKRAPQLVKD